MFEKILFLILTFTIIGSCKKDDGPREKRYLDKIIIEKAKLAAWDILDGPDMTLFYRDAVVDSLANSGGSEVFDNVGPLQIPLTFEDVSFELTNFMEFRVLDVDEFSPDQIMYQIQVNPYRMSEDEGNPFTLWNADWTIKVFWKTD